MSDIILTQLYFFYLFIFCCTQRNLRDLRCTIIYNMCACTAARDTFSFPFLPSSIYITHILYIHTLNAHTYLHTLTHILRMSGIRVSIWCFGCLFYLSCFFFIFFLDLSHSSKRTERGFSSYTRMYIIIYMYIRCYMYNVPVYIHNTHTHTYI